MNWFSMALATAILWGLCYAATEQVVKYIDFKSYLFISSSISALGFLIWAYTDGSLVKDFGPKLAQGWPWVLLAASAAFLGAYCSCAAVKLGGASLASIIEISYPLWVILFIFLITGKNNLNVSLLVGGALIFLGTTLVIKGNN